MRGPGAGIERGLGAHRVFYLDDNPLTPPATSQTGKVVIDPNLYDIDRIELLRGPQGTLYGSGSMGGTVRLITNLPKLETFEGSVQGTLSAYRHSRRGDPSGANGRLQCPIQLSRISSKTWLWYKKPPASRLSAACARTHPQGPGGPGSPVSSTPW